MPLDECTAATELAFATDRFIFPHLMMLGHNGTAKFYGLAGLDEAQQYFGSVTAFPWGVWRDQAVHTADVQLFGRCVNLLSKTLAATTFELIRRPIQYL